MGSWEDGQRHGQGTYTHANGDVHVGSWVDGQAHGQGTFTYADGRKFEGTWHKGKRLSGLIEDMIHSADCRTLDTGRKVAWSRNFDVY